MLKLGGDIGGTSSRLMLAEVVNDKLVILAEKNYLSKQFDDLYQIIKTFFAEHKMRLHIDSVCLAVAGPVVSGESSITNLPWIVSECKLQALLNASSVKIINDFSAISYGIPLVSNDTVTLQKAEQVHKKNKLDYCVIGAGTGLGASHVIFRNDEMLVIPSEYGHTGFAPQTELQYEFANYLLKSSEYNSLESVLSGHGLITIYHFIKQYENLRPSEIVEQDMKRADPSQVISYYALNNLDNLCRQSLNLFIDIYGSAAGNYCLQCYPVEELYIAGGIAGKIYSDVFKERFLKAFIGKGVMSDKMKDISVKLVKQENVGLFGAISH